MRKGAPDAAVEFLKFFAEKQFAETLVKETGLIPVPKDARPALTDPNLTAVSDALNEDHATGFQLYLDQAYAPAVGQEINDSVAALIAGSKSPEQVTRSVTQVAKSEKS